MIPFKVGVDCDFRWLGNDIVIIIVVIDLSIAAVDIWNLERPLAPVLTKTKAGAILKLTVAILVF